MHRDHSQALRRTNLPRYSAHLIGLSVLVAALVVVLWPGALVTLALGALAVGVLLLTAMGLSRTWQRRPPCR